MASDPTDDELIDFADSLLGELDEKLRERAVLAESVRDHRDLWLLLFSVSRGMEDEELS